MLTNYEINIDGLIYQVNRKPFAYDLDYSKQRYDTYGILNDYISYLRMGYVQAYCGTNLTSLLDVGYGNGAFLKVAKKIIPNCFGTDISGYPVPNGVTFLDDWMANSYDVVTFFDVLEHFESPYIIKDLNTKYIVISLPWCHYFSDEWFENWKHRRPNEHLWFFNPQSMKSFANTCGYDLIGYADIEDTVRGHSADGSSNILCAALKKR